MPVMSGQYYVVSQAMSGKCCVDFQIMSGVTLTMLCCVLVHVRSHMLCHCNALQAHCVGVHLH